MRLASNAISKSLLTVKGYAKMPGFSFIFGWMTMSATFVAEIASSLKKRAVNNNSLSGRTG
ncbi:hypothetical protein D3C78_1902360 [compost metagenome]